MITVFDCVQPWPDKVNFIDGNKIVGYDMWQECCEDAGWLVLGVEDDDVNLTNQQVASAIERHWTPYSEEVQGLVSFEVKTRGSGKRYGIDFEFLTVEPIELSPASLDEGDCILFPLKTTKLSVYGANTKYYLIIYNSHNGYYHHGFNYNIEGYTGEGSI